MNSWLKDKIDYEIKNLKENLKLIALKQRDEEWKRDHYRHTFAVSAQRIFKILNTSITQETPAEVQETTKRELRVLANQLNEMIKS